MKIAPKLAVQSVTLLTQVYELARAEIPPYGHHTRAAEV